MNQQAWFGSVHLPCYVWKCSATVLCTTAVSEVFSNTPWPLFLWDSAGESSAGILQTLVQRLLWHERLRNTVLISQKGSQTISLQSVLNKEMVHIAKQRGSKMLQPKNESSHWEADCWLLACTQEGELLLLQEHDWKLSLKKTLKACRGMIPLALPTSNPFKKPITLSIAHLPAFLSDQGTAKPTGRGPSQAFWNPTEMSREQRHPTSSRTALIPSLVAEAPGALVLGAHDISGWLPPGAHPDCWVGRCSCLRLRVWLLQPKAFQQSSISIFPDTFH